MKSYKAFLRINNAITASIKWNRRESKWNFSVVHQTQRGEPLLVGSTVFLKFIVWLQLLSSGQIAREHKEIKSSARCKRRKKSSKNTCWGLLFLTDVFGDLQCLSLVSFNNCWSLFHPLLSSLCLLHCVLLLKRFTSSSPKMHNSGWDAATSFTK